MPKNAKGVCIKDANPPSHQHHKSQLCAASCWIARLEEGPALRKVKRVLSQACLKIMQILLFSVKHPVTSLDINQSVCYIATRLSHTWEDRLQRGPQCLLSAWSVQGLQHDDRWFRWFRWPMKMYHCSHRTCDKASPFLRSERFSCIRMWNREPSDLCEVTSWLAPAKGVELGSGEGATSPVKLWVSSSPGVQAFAWTETNLSYHPVESKENSTRINTTSVTWLVIQPELQRSRGSV
jgi:hypothetical protein